MKKFRWILISLISLAVLFLSAFIILKNTHTTGNDTAGSGKEKYFKDESVEALSGVIESSYRFSNLPYGYITEDIEGNKKSVTDLTGNGKKLVLSYSELNCDVCVDSALTYFTRFAQKVGEQNVVLLVKYESAEYLSQLMRLNNLKLTHIYHVTGKERSAIAMDERDAPFLFVLDSSRVMTDVFFPLKEMPNLSEMYYNTVYEKYFRK
jgi:hypothetical protein